LPRQVSKHNPSPVQEILGDAAGQLNLVAGLDPDPLEAFSTDFTELTYANGNRKAYLMAVVDLESKYVLGWAVGPSANRKLAMRCWEQVRERMASLDEKLDEKIIHHDLDSVYTSYRWLRSMLLDDGLRVSYSENGARERSTRTEQKAIPGLNRCGDGRRPRSAHGSQRPRPCRHCEPSLTSGSGITARSDDILRSGRFRPGNILIKLSILSSQNPKSLLCLSRN
jgi:transposase InsO family protein